MLTIQQAADEYGLSDKTIRRWIAQGRLRAYRVGPRAIRVDKDSLLNAVRPMPV
jgi:excisionase family DNA binding protein